MFCVSNNQLVQDFFFWISIDNQMNFFVFVVSSQKTNPRLVRDEVCLGAMVPSLGLSGSIEMNLGRVCTFPIIGGAHWQHIRQ